MGWDRRGYYYRARKVNGRVIREYVGSGLIATLAAQEDAAKREQRKSEQAREKAERKKLEALDTPLKELNKLADLLAYAALRIAGFHQHKRGEWRKRRVRPKEAA